MQAALLDGRRGVIMVICSICGEEYKIDHQLSGKIYVAPHVCNQMEQSYFDRVCSSCDSLIRCRRDGFDCREAWDQPKGDWQGGHELYVRGDR